jgi:large subunit ribosomal protein L40
MSAAVLARQRVVPIAQASSRTLSTTSIRRARKPEGEAGDPKRQQLRKTLYPGNVRTGAAPTGTWRPDVGRALQRAIPSVQAHETIERAWLLHQRRVRQAREAERVRKFACMRDAADALLAIDPELYRAANRSEDPRVRTEVEQGLSKTLRGAERRAMEGRIRGLFPRDLRPPTDTPPKDGWKYEWTPVISQASSSCSSLSSISPRFMLILLNLRNFALFRSSCSIRTPRNTFFCGRRTKTCGCFRKTYSMRKRSPKLPSRACHMGQARPCPSVRQSLVRVRSWR